MNWGRNEDPFSLSRELGAAFSRLSVFRSSMRRASTLQDPFLGRLFPGKATLDTIRSLDPKDPLRHGLWRWALHLTLERIQVPAARHEADLMFRELHGVKDPVDGTFSLATMRARALEAGQERSAAWWHCVERCETNLANCRREIWARHGEIAERLGLERQVFVRDPTEGTGEVEQSLEHLALRLLSQTNAAARELHASSWSSMIECSMAREAADGWPARLAPDTMRALLGQRELFLGLNLAPGPLPERWAPASFVRAGARVGRALSRALSPADVPFVIARDPDDFVGHRNGELFSGWMVGLPFLVRALGLSRAKALDSARHLRAARLVHARLAASRYLIARAALASSADLSDRYEEVTHALVGSRLPPSSTLARFEVRLDAGARLAGLLAASADQERYVEIYDEDWYRNPRFQEELRATSSLPALSLPTPDGATYDLCERGLSALGSGFF